ncbi:MAG: DUF3160 domain-containing protein, partial [Planctomycetota bacterium]|nr:DUF3160 domain-containing protein [Planctomycetota bacterium]
MRSTRLFIFVALLAVAVAGVLALTCFRRPSPNALRGGEWTGRGADIEIKLPAQPIALAPLIAGVLRHPVQCTPRLKPLPIAQDLSNVNGLDEALLQGWSSARKKKLAANGFLISSSTYNDFYDSYTTNPTPFVTADSVFHVYHVILADTLVHLERLETMPRLRTLCVRAQANMRSLYDAAPAESRAGLRGALLYWTVAALLCDAGTAPHADVGAEAQAEAQRIAVAAAAGEFLGARRDYTVFKPIAGYEASAERAAHFRLNRYLTLTPLGYDSDEAART